MALKDFVKIYNAHKAWTSYPYVNCMECGRSCHHKEAMAFGNTNPNALLANYMCSSCADRWRTEEMNKGKIKREKK